MCSLGIAQWLSLDVAQRDHLARAGQHQCQLILIDVFCALAELAAQLDAFNVLRGAYPHTLPGLITQCLDLLLQALELGIEVALQGFTLGQQAAADDQRCAKIGKLQDVDAGVLSSLCGRSN
jgi:hypothetical protein